MRYNFLGLIFILSSFLKRQTEEVAYRKATCDSDGVYTSRIEGEKQVLDGDIGTILDVFLAACESDPKKNFLGTIVNGRVKYLNYEDTFIKVNKIASFLRTIVKNQEIVGIYSINRTEWVLAEYATYFSNCVNCPLYATFGPEALRYILSETEFKTCFASGEKTTSLLKEVLNDTKQIYIKNIISFDRVNQEVVEGYKKLGIQVHFLEEIIENGFLEGDIQEWKYPLEDDLATICYTSGTTGNPKGVLLTHSNFISSLKGFQEGSTNGYIFQITSDDVYISFLPLAHVMERLIFLVLLSKRAVIVFYRGDFKLFKEDCVIIRPTFIAGVPRVYNGIKEKIEEAISKKRSTQRWLINYAIKQKISNQKTGTYSHTFFDALIFSKIKKMFGGRIRAALSGSAALSPSTCEYLQAVFSMPIFQGYGQTEGSATNFVVPIGCPTLGSIGIPMPCNQAKMGSIEMVDGVERGELLLKGENICKGYFKNPEATEKLFDEDGWLRTGDMVEVHDGLFKIVGRYKEIFKTSLGEYIIPDKVEDALKIPGIEDIYITGRSSCDYIVALIVCNDLNIDEDTLLRLIQKKGAQQRTAGKIAPYEIPKRIKLLRGDYSVCWYTATLKKARTKIERDFKGEIEAMLD